MKGIKNGLLGALALITCPCLLPLWLAVLAGTSAGAWVGRYEGLLFGGMTALFILSGYILLRRLGSGSRA